MSRFGRAGAVLLAAAGAVGLVASFGEMWSLHRGQAVEYDPDPENFRVVTSLWDITSRSDVLPDWYVPPSYGVPLVACFVLMIAGAVLGLRGALVGAIARGASMVVSGVLAGIVIAYVLALQNQEQLDNNNFGDLEVKTVYTWQAGLYGLVAAAVLGLAGAVLTQRFTAVAVAEPVEDEHPDGVVIHQIGDADADDADDTDTPPFGLAVLHPDDEERR